MTSDYDSDDSEINPSLIENIIKNCQSGSKNSIKKLLKLYHDSVRSLCSKKEELRDKISIDESLYADLIESAQEYAIKLFDQFGPVKDEGPDSKIKITAKTFVLDTLLLISYSKSPLKSIRLSLITLSKPNILRWIIAINHVETQFLKIVFKLLSNYPNHKIRLSSFSILKLYLETVLQPEYNKSQYGNIIYNLGSILRNGLKAQNPTELSTRRLNTLSIGLYKSYLHSLSKGLNPRNWTLSRLSRNCVVELLVMINTDLLYTIAFKQLRKIGKDTIEAWKKSKLDSICNWAFVESLTIWSTVIGRLTPDLDHLVYPLVTISTASLKLGQSNEKFAPFILYISKELNHLSLNINKFIPIASHLLAVLDKICKSTDSKVKSKLKDRTEGPMPELAVFKLSLSNKDNEIIHHVEDLSRIIITQHISILAHHPSFPEIILPIIHHLKKYKTKRQWIKKLLLLINESSEMIKNLRKDIKIDNANLDKLIFFKKSKIPIIIHSLNEMEIMDKAIGKLVGKTEENQVKNT